MINISIIIVLATILIFLIALTYRIFSTDNKKDAIENALKRQMETMQTIHDKQMDALRREYEERAETIRRESQQQREQMMKESLLLRDQMKSDSEARFTKLASEIMGTSSDTLRERNAEQLNAIITPLKENIESFRKAINDTYVKENASRKSLTDQIDRLIDLNHTIGTEARNLTSALQGNSKIQGDWGELILETMLEESGLVKGIHFNTQVTRDTSGNVIRDDEGRQKRPDVVINLPDSRKMVIDSKVSLTAFTQYASADNEDERKKAGMAHLLSVRKHIDELATKDYQKDIEGSADHVMMFIPNEGAYIAAVQLDSNLWKYAYDKHIAIVSPTHLFSVMRIISQLWIQDAQNRNVIAIAKKGGVLYDKLVKFSTEFTRMEKALDSAVSACAEARKVLSTGKGNVISQAETLKKLGAKTSKSLPQSIIDDAEITEKE